MTKPRCKLEVVTPDDVLVIGINDVWFRTFTSSSDRYPLVLEVPADVLRDPWNVITGAYTNIAMGNKNDANVAYRVLLDDAEVVSVIYKADIAPAQTFTVQFRDSFHLKQRAVERGTSTGRATSRFQDLMKFQGPQAGGAPGR